MLLDGVLPLYYHMIAEACPASRSLFKVNSPTTPFLLLLSFFYFFLTVEDCYCVINLKLFVFQPIIFLATKVLDTGPLLAESQYYFTEDSG